MARKIKIVIISDTHCSHQKITIPKTDLLIHCGDFSWTGKPQEVLNFMTWFKKQPAKYKIFICGNHEREIDSTHGDYNAVSKGIIMNHLDDNMCYLEDQAVIIEGIKFYGTPHTSYFGGWGFNGRDIEGTEGARDLEDVYNQIPEDTQVLICHGPPFGILDKNIENEHCGSRAMLKLLNSGKLSKLKLYLCGHLHESYGHKITYNGMHFCNVSSLDREYQNIKKPVVITLDQKGIVQDIEGYGDANT